MLFSFIHINIFSTTSNLYNDNFNLIYNKGKFGNLVFS